MSWFAATLGLVLGLRHALDPDHVAAVATLLAGGPRRGSARRGLLLGAWWGLGHAATLVACIAILSALRLTLHPTLPITFELAVSVLLIALGVRSLWQSWRGANRGAMAIHHHGRAIHTHPMTLPHLHLGEVAVAWRPLLIGGLHGLAGSGGMMLLLSSRQATGWGIAGFTAAFVLGSILSMAMVTAVGALALGAMHRGAQRVLMAVAGVTSIAIGVAWALPQLALLT